MAKRGTEPQERRESISEILDAIAQEKQISKETLYTAMEASLMTACRNNFGQAAEARVQIDRDTGEYACFLRKDVVETADDVMDPAIEIGLADALLIDPDTAVGGSVEVPVESKSFGRIATMNAKNVIMQAIREEEKNAIYNLYHGLEHQAVTAVVQHDRRDNSVIVSLGKTDAVLTEKERMKNEYLHPNDRIKVLILEVRKADAPDQPDPAAVPGAEPRRKSRKGRDTYISVSRTHPELVERLFEAEVTEIQDGTVQICAIAREAGSRTKMAVKSLNPNVDPIGACVGMNGSRVNAVVDELSGERVDIIEWDDNPANLIRNALSPARVTDVFADPEERIARVVVPDAELSLAIGRSGQNARLAAKLTGYKVDIRSQSQAVGIEGFSYDDYAPGEEPLYGELPTGDPLYEGMPSGELPSGDPLYEGMPSGEPLYDGMPSGEPPYGGAPSGVMPDSEPAFMDADLDELLIEPVPEDIVNE